MDIKKNIEGIRKSKGISQEELAKMLGVRQSTYSGYFSKNNSFKFSLILEIADKLEVDVIDIISFPEKLVPEGSKCQKCEKKDKIIDNLNALIDNLNDKK